LRFGIFEAQLELSDFNVTMGDSIDTLRIDNNGQPRCCAGADIGDIWVADAGGIGLSTPTQKSVQQMFSSSITAI
jgi:hypothetical protein